MSANVIPMTAARQPEDKPTYAAVPVRAIGDDRLQRGHLKALAAIAAHARLGRNGVGCWASHERLAAMANIGLTRLSEYITDLKEWGYVEQSVHPADGRKRVYNVAYTIADHVAMNHPKTPPKPNANRSAPAEVSQEDRSAPAEPFQGDRSAPAEVSGGDRSGGDHPKPNEINEKTSLIYSVKREDRNILSTGYVQGRDPAEADGTYSGEPAPPKHTDGNVGGKLAAIERRLRSRSVANHELPIFRRSLQQIADDYIGDGGSPEDSLGQRARRLLETWFPE